MNKIIYDCAAIGVKCMVVNGTCEEDWATVAQLAHEHPIVHPSFGLHPWNIKNRSNNWLITLRHYLEDMPASIGEIGLDRWIDGFDIQEQIKVFDAQWQLAAELNRPVTIHCLKAWGLLLEKLHTGPRHQQGFLLHSYNGSEELITPLAQLGGYFSISGYFAHERKKQHHHTLKKIPIDRLLLETDAPHMLPPQELNKYPIKKYTINHPANIQTVYQFAATLFDIPEIDLKKQVADNFKRLFNC